MVFNWIRKRLKWLIALVAVTFAVGLLYVGVPFFTADTATSGVVLAKVNGKDISYSEHRSTFQNLLAQYQMFYGQLSPADQEFLSYQALEMVVEQKLMLEAARAEGIQIPRSELDAELNSLKALFSSDEEYRARLRDVGLTERELRNAIQEDLLVRKALEKRRSEIEISDQQVAEAYEAVNARHILIRPEVGEDGELDWDAALQKAQEIYAELQDGADFAELAAEHSDDGSASQGGALGFFNRGLMVPEFEEAAFSLAEGEISEPVRTQFGYHIIQVTERRQAEGEEFESQKESIRAQLQSQQAEQVIGAWIADLRSAADVEIFDPHLKAVGYVMNNQLAQAITYYEQAIENEPNNGYINFSLGNVYLLLGDTGRAIEQFRAATDKQPYDAQLHYALGQALIENGDVDAGVQSLLTASEWAPNDFYLQSQLVGTLTDLERSEEAEIVQARLDDLLARLQAQQQALQQQQEAELQLEGMSDQDVLQLLDDAASAAQQRLQEEQGAADGADE